MSFTHNHWLCAVCVWDCRTQSNVPPETIYNRYPLPLSRIRLKVSDLYVHEFIALVTWVHHNSFNTADLSRLRNAIVPFNEDQMQRINKDYYRKPPPDYAEYMAVSTHHHPSTAPQRASQRHMYPPYPCLSLHTPWMSPTFIPFPP